MSGNKIKSAYFGFSGFSRGFTMISQLKKENNQKLTTGLNSAFSSNVAPGLGETSLETLKV